MAAEQVFNLPELLEAILLQLPLTSIFLVKAVSKTWNQAIASSIKLQRALFLAPDGGVLQPVQEDLVGCLEKSWFEDCPVLQAGPSDPLSNFLSIEPPVFGWWYPWWRHDDPVDGTPLDQRTYRTGKYSGHAGDIKCDTGSRILMPRPLRSMFLCQPPVAAVMLRVKRNSWTAEHDVVAYDRNGVTLGLVADTWARVRESIMKLPFDRCVPEELWETATNRTHDLQIEFVVKGQN